jgi:hypothetical protein
MMKTWLLSRQCVFERLHVKASSQILSCRLSRQLGNIFAELELTSRGEVLPVWLDVFGVDSQAYIATVRLIPTFEPHVGCGFDHCADNQLYSIDSS